MPPSVLASPTATSLIATAVLFVSFAAYSAPVQMPALTKEPAVGYAEPTPASPAGEQQDSVVVPPESRGSSADLDDRSYLVETASPGATMVRQGPALAIARLNPEFATRLAAAIREARDAGLPSAGIFSAYRPPVFGIGGFADKFNSLHSYGLAVDMSGIGEPGSKDARLWHEIAARHGVFCPYGADNRKEWNHCQATPIMKVAAGNPLRGTITADGPARLDEMFKVGGAVIADLPAAIGSAEAANNAEHSTAARPNVVREAARMATRSGRRIEARRTLVASLDARHLAKSHRPAAVEAKTARLHRVGPASAESRHDLTRRRSRSA